MTDDQNPHNNGVVLRYCYGEELTKMSLMEPQSDTKQISSEEEKILTVAVNLASYFIKNGHTAEDLKSAILTTMNIRL